MADRFARDPERFTDAEHVAASALSAVTHTGRIELPVGTTCVPLLISRDQAQGPGGVVFSFGEQGLFLSISPAREHCPLTEAAASVFPHDLLPDAWAVGFVLYLQIAQVTVDPVAVQASADASQLPEAPVVAKVIPRGLAELARSDDLGVGAIGCVLRMHDGAHAFVISPAEDPRRSVAAVDEVAWAGVDIPTVLLDRLMGSETSVFPFDLVLPVGILYVQGWLQRIIEACDRHGSDDARVRRVAERAPNPATVERMTQERLLAAALDGRLPSPLSAQAMRWAGPELTTHALMAEYRSPGLQLDEIALHDESLADEVKRTLRERFGITP
jgi:hypothetical protein